MQSAAAFATPATVSALSSFTAHHHAVTSRRAPAPSVARPVRRATIDMRSDENLAKKVVKVSQVKEKLENANLIFAVEAAGLSVKDLADLKNRLPETTVISTVKNTLMRRAIAESEWECGGELTNQSNLWFFVGGDIKETWKVYESFSTELERPAPKGGVFEGTKYDTEGISAIAALPSKKELITKVAVALNMIPTKLARSVKAVPTKVGRAIKLAVASEGDGDAPAAE